ncbi:MAG TPA: hypothetical protein VK460_06770 [Burkholderiales bacterium]|nr:hypothetical protein [Burkholderiales bacterium]
MVDPLHKPSDKADRPDKPLSLWVAAKCGVCFVALLGFVVQATTFVARLAAILILLATQSAEDFIRGSFSFADRVAAAPGLGLARAWSGKGRKLPQETL